jgi:hypothetical protein
MKIVTNGRWLWTCTNGSTTVNFLKRQEGLDVYDYETRFNPLLIGE